MTTSYLFLVLGLALLWVPRNWLRRGRPESQSRRQGSGNRPAARKRERLPGDQSLWLGEEFAKRRNWLDLGRAFAGGYAVMLALPEIVQTDWRPAFGTPVEWVQAPLFAIGVVLQTLRWEGRLVLFPPVFYVLGLAFPLIGAKAATLAFVAIWSINLVMPGAAGFLFTYAVVGLILGLLMDAGLGRAGLLAGVSLMAPFLAVMTKRRLAQFSKKTKVVVR